LRHILRPITPTGSNPFIPGKSLKNAGIAVKIRPFAAFRSYTPSKDGRTPLHRLQMVALGVSRTVGKALECGVASLTRKGKYV